MNPKAVPLPRRRAQLPAAADAYCLRQGILKLLAIKDLDHRDLRSKTQGRASYSMQFDSYAQVPSSVATEIIAKAKGE